ncbi:sugar transporter [Nitzschia inconspicua]|uniref:Sugar transporter n=1 Tax=Nitzschia inconspicua TaxID=303405 RepID=A0A9K3L7H4_9STRA|nr:sugar transporter [Nitzschia inconspicua]
MDCDQQNTRRQGEIEPLKRRNKTKRDHEECSSEKDNFHSFLPSPLRQCLSGKEIVRKGAFEDNTSTATSTAASSKSVPCDVFGEMKGKSVSECSLAPSELDFSASATAFNGGGECYTSVSSMTSENIESEYDFETSDKGYSFLMFRLSYLFVTLVVMLADGLQGTHLYVLYEGYGFSVASLYCLGFITGAFTAPITGPLIDRFGRKKSALMYCALEMGINMLEQFPFLSGLIVSRVVGGITTNLLSTVFEAWVDTEYRNRSFAEKEYETLMRDSVVVSNLAAIASGYLAHILAESFGNVGPFEGAVTCTGIAFVVIFLLWTENYGKPLGGGTTEGTVPTEKSNEKGDVVKMAVKPKSALAELKDTLSFIKSDSRILRVCITQGLTLGSLHIFIFLWSPLLKEFSTAASGTAWGLDSLGEPAYGLIFGAFMAAGVLGGLCSPLCRKLVTLLLSPLTKSSVPETVTVDGEGSVRPMDVEFQGALCYFFCSVLLLAPCCMSASNENTFSVALFCFIAYEFSVGIYSPCEGVMRSIYIPPESRGSIMTVPSIIVNVAVALAVVSTESISRQTALCVISVLMMTCCCLQLSLVSSKEWASLFGRVEKVRKASLRPLESFSTSASELGRSLSVRFSSSMQLTESFGDLKEKEE